MRKLRFAIALCALAAGVAAYVSGVPGTKAAIPYDYDPYVCTWFATSTYKDPVGRYLLGCCGRVRTWGTTSPYVQCQKLDCSVLCEM